MTKEEKDMLIEHCETSIKVCEEKIEVEGENGESFWVELKEEWENKLESLLND